MNFGEEQFARPVSPRAPACQYNAATEAARAKRCRLNTRRDFSTIRQPRLAKTPMRLKPILLFAAILLVPGSPAAFERDVHFGLTQWLALQAGFSPQEAEALATGDQRVDSGDIQFIELVTMYACLKKDEESAAEDARHHYPSPGKLPGPPDQRAVPAGGDPARQRAIDATKVAANQAGYLLYRLGEALHGLQDSWSHQGIPDVPQVLDGVVACDPLLASAHPRSRGGWDSHKADLTHLWPADTMAMASATYEVLLQYPAMMGVKRSPKPWAEIRPALDGFVRASTKAQKKKWFNEHGIADVSFLEGITLADGTEAFDLRWEAHKLPRLTKLDSTQHHVDPDLLDFFSRFFTQWTSTDDFDALAAAFGAALPVSPKAARAPLAPMSAAELAARLRAWRIRDHGRVADLAHAPQPLTAQQRNTLASIAKNPAALARYASPADAFFPLLEKTPEPVPLLGFLVNTVAPATGGGERALATAKFRHVPYDTLEVLAERVDGRWRVVSLAATVDH